VKSRLTLQIGLASLVRLLLNTARRFAYPFASALSQGLGVPLVAITSLVAANQVTGALSPVFGPLGDRWGYRVMMLAGLGALAAGMLAGGFFPIYSVVLLALFLAGLGKSVFDPALQAYVGERAPYRRRGMAIGALEFAWSGSALVGLPLIGLLIEWAGWRAPFFVLGGLGLAGAIALGALVPNDAHRRPTTGAALGFREIWRMLSREPAALGALGFSFLIGAANDNLFLAYGVWLKSNFNLSLSTLGVATAIIGAAELLGEGLTVAIADRVGLRRAVAVGSALSALSYALLPLTGRTLPLSLLGLFAVFLTFEFAVVTSFSHFTQVLPAARGTMMSSVLAAASLGRVVGAFVSGPVWLTGGMPAIGLVSAAISALALICLLWGWSWEG